jgi:hypothetical protein
MKARAAINDRRAIAARQCSVRHTIGTHTLRAAGIHAAEDLIRRA